VLDRQLIVHWIFGHAQSSDLAFEGQQHCLFKVIGKNQIQLADQNLFSLEFSQQT
jgi:hypothetical protein